MLRGAGFCLGSMGCRCCVRTRSGGSTDDNTKGWHDVEEAPPRNPSSPILREPELSDHEQQAVVNLDSDDDSDDSSLSDIRRDVRELQQELGMEPQEPLLSDDESEDNDIYGAPQQRPTVRFEDSADPSPTQDQPTNDCRDVLSTAPRACCECRE